MNKILLIPYVLIFFLVPLTCHAETISGEMDRIPWAGYWWPTRSGELVTGYKGSPAPFEKYDLYTSALQNGPLTRWGKNSDNLIYDTTAETWNGQCHAWASAALMEPYEFVPSIEHGIVFNTGDKKGLVTILHQKDISTNIKFCDKDPLYFHTSLLEYVGEHKLGLCADLDAGDEVWTYPIYKYSGNITYYDTYDDVEMTIYYANDDVDPDFLGDNILNSTYTYRLYKDGTGYTNGEWRNYSITTHPQSCWFPTTVQTDAPFDGSIVRHLAQTTYDGLENGDNLPTGLSSIILDYGETKEFIFEVPEDTNNIKFKFIADEHRDSDTYIEYNLYSDDVWISSGDITDELMYESQDISGSTLKLELSFKLSGLAGKYPIVCHVYFDVKLPHTVHLPGQMESLWHGLAISNTSEQVTSNTIYSTFLSTEGDPRVGYGPVTLGQGQHWSSLIDHLDWIDINSYDSIGDLKITSQHPIETLRLFGNEDSLFGAFSSRSYPTSINSWVVPLLTPTLGTTSAKLFITNTSDDSAEGQISYFSSSGNSLGSSSVSLSALETGEYSSGSYPGSRDINGWALLTDSQGVFAGTIQHREAVDLRDEISLLTSDTEWRVLHPAVLSGWSTELTLFNTNDSAAKVNMDLLSPQRYEGRYSITLAPYEKSSIELTGELWNLNDFVVDAGSVEIASESEIAGYVTYRHASNGLLASLPLVGSEDETSNKVLGHVASNEIWWTGVVLYNPTSQSSSITFRGLSENGTEIAQTTRTVGSYNKLAVMVRDLFPDTHENIVTIRISASTLIAGYALFGDLTSPGFSYLSALIM